MVFCQVYQCHETYTFKKANSMVRSDINCKRAVSLWYEDLLERLMCCVQVRYKGTWTAPCGKRFTMTKTSLAFLS